MAPDVKGAFEKLAMKFGSMDQPQAQEWMSKLIDNGRYQQDVYA
jgi:sulfite reductase alpha subunit-like flavoprotein